MSQIVRSFFAWGKKRANKTTSLDIREEMSEEREDTEICPICGGNGEIRNPDHYQYDECYDDYEYKYVPCPRCFGKGYVYKERHIN